MRCKEVTAENERLEAALAELEREKKCADKKVQQVRKWVGSCSFLPLGGSSVFVK